MTVGIVGSRRRADMKDYLAVELAFNKIADLDTRIVSGGCSRGGDAFAEFIAKKQQRVITIYYAEWRHRGKTAGFYRNTAVAKDSDVLIACVAEDRSGGTEDTITKFCKRLNFTELQAIKAGKLVLV